MASKKLTHDERIKIVVLHEEGYSTVQISKRIKHNQSSVSRTLSRLKKTGSVDDRKRTGRPRITTPREDRSLLRICLNDRRLTSPQLKREWMESCGVQCSSRTVRRRLVKEGLHGRVARKKPLLTQRHKRVRLKWAMGRKHWTLSQWHQIIWSDESIFNLFGSDGRVCVRRRKGEEFLPECINQTVKFGGGSVMMWGCISCGGVGPLVKVDGRMKAIDYIQLLNTSLLPYMSSMGSTFQFMDDNAPCHRTKTVANWMSAKNLNRMEVWPPQSPDLNPIEHVWDILGDKVQEKKPKNLKELEKILQEEWKKISVLDIQTLINSMPRRVAAVIAVKDGHTKY